MKRPLQLPIAIALAFAGTNAMALGLGPVHVKSRLNEPLVAEIPVIEGSAGEAEGLLVSLATADDFERIGISRSRLNVPLEFAVVRGSGGQTVIKVTSKDPVRDAYLDFLVEANWPKGRLLREYTVLLDPPVTAPRTGVATAPAPRVTPSAPARPARPAPSAAPATAAAPAARPAPAPAPSPKLADGQYGPVAAGETLSAIARSVRGQTGGDLNQVMIALLKSNPDAFYKDNINALKRGAILRVPSAGDLEAAGSASQAAAEVQAQIEDWRGGRVGATRVAASGDSAAPARSRAASGSSRTAAKSDERLELVPPKAGKDSLAMADRPGAGTSSGGGNGAALKAELARTKEALVTREQESDELRARVKELEDIADKNDRLISLKDSEIADLQRKLRELQQGTASTGSATPATDTVKPEPTPAAPASPTPTPTSSSVETDTATAPLDKKDIWGDTPTVATPADSAKPAIETDTATPPAVAAASAAPASAAAGAENATGVPEQAASGAQVTPLAPPPETKPASPAPKPATPPAKPAVKPVPAPAPVAAPWYEAAWVKPAAIAAGVLLLLAALLGLRRRKKPAAAAGTRSSIADQFGQSSFHDEPKVASTMDAEAKALRDQLANDPRNLGLYLELLSVHYAERDVSSFEAAAAEMYTHVADPQQIEWQEAVAMGQELAPHNPLFAAPSEEVVADAYVDELPRAEEVAHEVQEDQEFVVPPPEDDFVFGEESRETASSASEPFSFDDLPPIDEPVREEPMHEAADTPEETAEPFDDGFFGGEDAVGTKLDLAKAYLDMGDPDGARSMLEEVLAEGDDAQRAEAQRLIDELR